MNDLPLRPVEIGAVEDRFSTVGNFPLTDGTVMLEATIAYETYGRLAPRLRSRTGSRQGPERYYRGCS